METMLEGSKTDPRPPLHNYKVTVITSDIRNAGTDADIFIDIKGQNRLRCMYRPTPGRARTNTALSTLHCQDTTVA